MKKDMPYTLPRLHYGKYDITVELHKQLPRFLLQIILKIKNIFSFKIKTSMVFEIWNKQNDIK